MSTLHGTMLIFSISLQFYQMSPTRWLCPNPRRNVNQQLSRSGPRGTNNRRGLLPFPILVWLAPTESTIFLKSTWSNLYICIWSYIRTCNTSIELLKKNILTDEERGGPGNLWRCIRWEFESMLNYQFREFDLLETLERQFVKFEHRSKTKCADLREKLSQEKLRKEEGWIHYDEEIGTRCEKIGNTECN